MWEKLLAILCKVLSAICLFCVVALGFCLINYIVSSIIAGVFLVEPVSLLSKICYWLIMIMVNAAYSLVQYLQ